MSNHGVIMIDFIKKNWYKIVLIALIFVFGLLIGSRGCSESQKGFPFQELLDVESRVAQERKLIRDEYERRIEEIEEEHANEISSIIEGHEQRYLLFRSDANLLNEFLRSLLVPGAPPPSESSAGVSSGGSGDRIRGWVDSAFAPFP